MNGPELFRLGRRLMKLGVHATPDAGFRDLPTGVRIVLVDVYEHPDATIGQIVERTGLPQSIVSGAVARLRESGALLTTTDPADRRRTLVRPAHARPRRRQPDRPATKALEQLLVELHGPGGRERLPEVLEALDVLARNLTPTPAPVVVGGRSC
jgi:DNA-binding MarR family transcriptional regulator